MPFNAQVRSCNDHLVPQTLMTSSEDSPLCSNPQRHSSLPSTDSSQIITPLAQKQRHEIQQYINHQCEGLRLNIHEQRKRDFVTIINQIETRFSDILIQQHQHIVRARNRTAQLELILHRAETEHQQWRNLALLKETQSIHLNNTLQQMLLHHQTKDETDGDDDAESCCDVGRNRGSRLCRGCGERDACVVLLPCRHLCCCIGCEIRIDSCLVCRCLKQNAVQVMFS